MSKAIVKIKISRHPVSQFEIGFRLEAAVPNSQGRLMRAIENNGDLSFYATKESVPSFKKPYLIMQSSDYSIMDKKVIERFLDNLKWQGYDEYEFMGKIGDTQLRDIARGL